MCKTMKEALEFLKSKYSMYSSMRSGDGKWHRVLNTSTFISCEVTEHEDGNITWEMTVVYKYATLRYQSMNIVHLGTASDLAYNRLLAIKLATAHLED